MTGSASSEEDIELDDVYDDDIKVVSEGKKAYEVDYKPLTHQQVKDLMVVDVDYISTIFGVEVSLYVFAYDGAILTICVPPIEQSELAALLLRHMDWNKDRLTEKYMDNASSISIAAGVFSAPKPSSPTQDRSKRVTRSSKSSKKLEQSSFSEPFLCPVCFDDTATDTLALSCGHAFCTGCWTAHAAGKIRDEGEHRILCMAENCGVVALDSFIHKVLSEDQDTAARYDELLVRNYVACNKNLKYCPFPSCDRSVSCPSASSRSALFTIVPTVSCGADPKHKFCFGCNIDGDHRPVLCAIARMWLKKCRDDSETANWIKSNTKECSKCQSTIEKNGGCKYVSIPSFRLYRA
jgi:ariadne-1